MAGMSREQFVALVKRLEAYAERHPTLYRIRVYALGVLGYAYIFLILVGLLLAVAAAAYAAVVGKGAGALYLVQGIAALLALIGVVVRSLWVRMPLPEGLALAPAVVPRLFEAVEKIRKALQSPKVHQVMLTNDFNAGVVQWPRLGAFGWPRNYLVLGLPLMQALSPEQFEAVLAHEFGHVSRSHGRFTAWIYRIRKTWIQLQYFPEKPFYVTAVVPKGGWRRGLDSKTADNELCNRTVSLVRDYVGDGYVMVLTGNNKKFKKLIAKVEGAKIYSYASG